MSEPLLSGKQPNTVSKKRKLGSLCLLCTEEYQEECKSNHSNGKMKLLNKEILITRKEKKGEGASTKRRRRKKQR